MKNIILVIFTIGFLSPLPAQETPRYDEFAAAFKKESFSIGALLQVVGDAQSQRTAPGQNGFSIANLRLKFYGKLDGGFSYFLQTSHLNVPSILLDAFMSYVIIDHVSIDAGLMKAPFSKEYLTSAADIDFVNRSQGVSALKLGRQAGIQAKGEMGAGMVKYRAGIFNGNTGSAGNDNSDFLFAGRASLFPLAESKSNTLEIGINGGRSFDKSVIIQSVRFSGVRTIAGGDIRWTTEKILFSCEYVTTEFNFTGGGTRTPEGYQVTGGYMITEKSQLLLRYDSYRSHGLGTDSDLFIAGFNLWPTNVTGLQINLIVPRLNTGANKPQLLVNLQISI